MGLEQHLSNPNEKGYDQALCQILYEVPSHGTPNIEHFLRSKVRNRQALERIDIETKLSEQKEQNELQKLLEIALSSSDTSLQRTGARFISSLEEAARREFCEKLSNSLVEMSLSSDTKKHLVLAEIIRHNSEYIPLEKIKDRLTSLLERDLGSKDISVQEVGVKIIELLPESTDKRHYESKLREWLLQKILSRENQEQINAARLLGFTSHEILFELGEKILHGDNEEAKEIAARYIKRLDPLKSVPLLRLTFNTKSLQLKKIGAEATTRLFRTHNKQPKVPLFITSAITETVRASLESDDRNIQRIGSEMLKDVTNTKDLIDLVRLGVNSNDRTVKLNAIAAIRFIDTRFDFGKRAMSDFIEQALQSEDTNIQRVAITISRHVPEPEKDKCMNQAFALVSKLVNSENRASQKRGTEMMYYINHPKIETLFSEKIEPDQELLNILLFSRLYPDHESASKFPFRVNLPKTGSRMSILRGGTIEKKIIIRHIKEKSFRGWMRAYEQHDKWFDSGFDYVPIEPIQSFAFRENAVDVYAGVLDIDLKHWLSLSGQRFKNELLEMRERITSVLQSMKIRHGDLHLGNFFVVFERKNGRIDTKTCPRLYVGDFDKSTVKK